MRAFIIGSLLALAAGPAWAEVTVTFYAHPGARIRAGYLLFPHAYVHATGSLDDTGDTVDWAAGLTARIRGPSCCSHAARAWSPIRTSAMSEKESRI